jgi:hypothetical protein
VRYMLMICDDESDDRGPLELVGDTEHVAWIDYMDRQGISFRDGVRLWQDASSGSVRTASCGVRAVPQSMDEFNSLSSRRRQK